MEREPSPAPPHEKLVDVVAREYPGAEIHVSFPDKWVLLNTFKQAGRSLYVAGFPPSQERARGDHFYGLPPEINRSLNYYRLYRLFEPWPQPIIPVAWDYARGRGVVLPGGHLAVQLQPIGQAQIWQGEIYAVCWECYLQKHARGQSEEELELLTQFWQAVEQTMDVHTIFTQPREPAFEGDYLAFLRSLDYAPDPKFQGWWSKQRQATGGSCFPY